MSIKKIILFLYLFFGINTMLSQNVCVDMEAHRNSIYYNKNIQHAFADKNLLWNTGQIIRVKFFGGSNYIRHKIMKYASEWEKYANINFQFVNSGYAEIRISFIQGAGSWSYIGTTSSTSIPQNEPSMNFGWFNNFTSEKEFRRVILHEFGHALGLLHEHKHSQTPFKWNIPKVYAFYQTKLGWTKEQVRREVIERYTDNSHFTNSVYDSKSIMHYPVPKELTLNGYEVPWNTELSETDKKNIAEIYPGRYTFTDSDGDGVPDNEDLCPYEYGSKNNNGCPEIIIVEKHRIDSDNDGVYDDEDRCPYQYGSKFNYGCPTPKVKRDSDNDGVSDDKDKCPYIYGSIYNNGCPVIKFNYGINYELMVGFGDNYTIEDYYNLQYIYAFKKKLNLQIGFGLYPKFAFSKIQPFAIINPLSYKESNFFQSYYNQEIVTGEILSLGVQPELGLRFYLDNNDLIYLNFSSSYFIPYYKRVNYLDNPTNSSIIIDKSYFDTKGFSFSLGGGVDFYDEPGVKFCSLKLDYFLDTSLFFSDPNTKGVFSNNTGFLKLSYIYYIF